MNTEPLTQAQIEDLEVGERFIDLEGDLLEVIKTKVVRDNRKRTVESICRVVKVNPNKEVDEFDTRPAEVGSDWFSSECGYNACIV